MSRLPEDGDPGDIMLTGGIYLEYGEQKPHYCKPPGFWRRRLDGVGMGAIWMCECRQQYKLHYTGWSFWPRPDKPVLIPRPK